MAYPVPTASELAFEDSIQAYSEQQTLSLLPDMDDRRVMGLLPWLGHDTEFSPAYRSGILPLPYEAAQVFYAEHGTGAADALVLQADEWYRIRSLNWYRNHPGQY
jgi:hypothetical protein